MKKCIFVLGIVCFATLSYGQSAKDQKPVDKEKFVLGYVDTIASTFLSETRVINISLPEGYSPDSAATYPVIYLLDGGADEDFVHIAGLVRYYNTPWVDRFPPSIVVGIANTNRRRDMTYAVPNLDFLSKVGFDKSLFPKYGGSKNFISFIESELQPYIQEHYKANSSKTIIGESMAGLLASEILIRKPELFDTYIIISPSLWWGSESLLTEATELSKQSFTQNLKIYIGAANKAEDLTMYNEAHNLFLRVKSFNRKNLQVHFDYLADETHATIIHHAVYDAFRVLYPQKK